MEIHVWKYFVRIFFHWQKSSFLLYVCAQCMFIIFYLVVSDGISHVGRLQLYLIIIQEPTLLRYSRIHTERWCDDCTSVSLSCVCLPLSSAALPVVLCLFLVSYWFFLTQTEGLRAEVVAHCKAHWSFCEKYIFPSSSSSYSFFLRTFVGVVGVSPK